MAGPGFCQIAKPIVKLADPMVEIMDDDQPLDPSLTAWQRSLQRLAAWMVRFNRTSEPARPEVRGRNPQAPRNDVPARRPVPPRP